MTRRPFGGTTGAEPDTSTPLPRFVRAVGWTSLALTALGAAAPRQLAAAGGVRDTGGGVLPVVVRLAAARQGVLGLALLTRRPTDVRRSAELFLPLTALDAAAVLAGVRSGALHRRSALMSLAVLGTNAEIARRARR